MRLCLNDLLVSLVIIEKNVEFLIKTYTFLIFLIRMSIGLCQSVQIWAAHFGLSSTFGAFEQSYIIIKCDNVFGLC